MSQRERYEKGGIGRWYWDYRDRAVMDYILDKPILDVGCGEGITTEKAGAIGMDLDQGNVRGSAYALPFRQGAFGTVLFLEVIEHLSNYGRALQEIHRVLKQGGKIIVLFPNDRAFKLAWFLCGMWGEIKKDRGHKWAFSPSFMQGFLEYFNFKVKENRSIPFHFWPLSLHHVVVGEKC
uniref:Putative methyltransferase n=1 Tax=viral metagenome TaxID=1070528 RepID=A0A6M3K2T0_9ZZZZ